MEQQNDLKEWGKKMAAIGVVGVLLVGGLSAVIFGPPVDKEVQAQGGLDAIVTPMACDHFTINGVQYSVCEDGSQWALEAISDPFAVEPTPIP